MPNGASDETVNSATQLVREPWGRLLPLRPDVQPLGLIKESFTFGTSNTDYIFTHNVFQEKYEQLYKTQCKIVRHEDGGVFLENTSEDSGTFVGAKALKSNQKFPLRNGDTIAFLERSFKLFIYYDCESNEQYKYPAAVTKNYIVMSSVGEGSFGNVLLAFKHGDFNRCAIKCLHKNNTSNLKSLRNEAMLMKSVSHPCLVSLLDVVDIGDRAYILMAFADGGHIKEKHLPEKTTKLYTYQVCEGLRYLHSLGIAHRDLKPQNILKVSAGAGSRVKLADFGLAKLKLQCSEMSTPCGTLQYVAPEVLEKRYTCKVDLWSLGVIMYRWLCGSHPFDKPQYGQKELARAICSGRFDFGGEAWGAVSEEARDLISKLLVLEPKQMWRMLGWRGRLSAEEALQHPWFQDAEVKELAAKVMAC